MSIKSFEEKEIRKAILNKIDPKEISKSGKHWKGYIYSGDVLVSKVKIPNDHKRPFHKNKAQYLARDLKLSDEHYNQLIECTLSGSRYYDLIKDLA